MRPSRVAGIIAVIAVTLVAGCVTGGGPADFVADTDGFNLAAKEEIATLGYDYDYPHFDRDDITSDTVFEGAVGYGIHTRAGTDGRVIRVTTLASSGPGSLREALQVDEPRLIVFEVGGVIDLEMQSLGISSPYVTVAGQTAPSPGITIIRGGVNIATHDVLIQHIRVRPGDGADLTRTGWEVDGISSYGRDAFNIVVDHCSVSWATDEGMSVSGPRLEGPEATSHYVTFSNCIIAENLNNATHSKGAHSKGTLIHDQVQFVALIGNLWAHNVDRNPYFKAFSTGFVVNNVIYNPGSNALRLGVVRSEWIDSPVDPLPARLTAIGNVLIHGPDTFARLAFIGTEGLAYLDDNLVLTADETDVRIVMGRIVELANPPLWLPEFTPLPASEVLDSVTQRAGARPADRDEVDARIIEEMLSGGGRIIDSQDDVGGYPHAEPTSRQLDVPDSGRREWLERMASEVE